MRAAPLVSLTLPLLACLPTDDPDLTQAELERMTAEIQADIEELRGQPFERPVAVSITDREGFLAYMKKRMASMSTPEELAAEESVAKLLGLIPADMDLMEKMLEILEAQVGGFYDPEQEAFHLMSSFTGPLAGTILAHELTHALDDQLYDIDGGLAARKGSSDALWAYSAVVEGSGSALMDIWTLQNVDLSELLESSMELMEQSLEPLADAPPYAWKPLFGTYEVGKRFLKAEEGTESPQSVARAFASPPRSSEQVLHPEKYWDPEERDEPVEVRIEPGGLPEGWEILAQDTLGELGLALFTEPLEKRKGVASPLAMMAVLYTNRSAKGWGGDRLVLLAKGGARLLHLETVWDTERDAEEFAEALEDLEDHLRAAATAYLAVLAEEEPELGRATPGFAMSRSGKRVAYTVGLGAGPELLGVAPTWLVSGGDAGAR